MKLFVETALRKQWLTISLLIGAGLLHAQNIPVGTWRTHFSYRSAQIIEPTADRLFVATLNGIYSIDRSDRSLRKLSKIDGLSDVGVSTMRYNESMNVLAIGYTSGLIDFIFEDDIVGVSTIFEANLEGDKRINAIAFYESQAYVATDLGIVVIELPDGNVRENLVQIGPDGDPALVKELAVVGNTLYAVAETQVQSGVLTENLLDFNNWNHLAGSAGYGSLTAVGSQVYALDGQNLLRLDGAVWADSGIDLPTGANKLFEARGILHTSSSQQVFELGSDDFTPVTTVSARQVNDLIFEESEWWIADEDLGVITGSGESIAPDGPLLDEYSRIKTLNGSTYGFHAPSVVGYDGSVKIESYSAFDEGTWQIVSIPDFSNVSDIALFEQELYFGSIGDGLYNQTVDQLITNIPLSSTEPDTMILALIGGNQLSVSSAFVSDPVHTFDGSQWSSISEALLFGDAFDELAISETGILWAQNLNQSVTVFDSEQGRNRLISGLPGSALDIEITVEDDGWIATTDGPVSFADASFIFEESTPILPSFENRVLFEGEPVNAVETDGGNRVWFATDRGLWVFDENTSQLAHLFSKENSPLPSDFILDLAYNGSTGEMFVLTPKGLLSYRSDSSIGSPTHSNVSVFPNPVPPDYFGLVGIEGLASNVSIKVTDLNGNLVKEIQANGGSASWDLMNNRNMNVVTGVYLLFSATQDGEETFIGKIAVIR